jgi:hypothetical protein
MLLTRNSEISPGSAWVSGFVSWAAEVAAGGGVGVLAVFEDLGSVDEDVACRWRTGGAGMLNRMHVAETFVSRGAPLILCGGSVVWGVRYSL